MNVEIRTEPKKRSLLLRLKKWMWHSLRLTDSPVVKLYTGYGNETQCYLYGHAFSFSPIPRKKYRQNLLINAFALLRLFMVRTKKGAVIRLLWKDEQFITRSEADGFFKFEWSPVIMPAIGYHDIEVHMLDLNGQIMATATAQLLIPPNNPFAVVSDIDDTFLISYSGNLRKRLYVLLTENALSRKPFDGVAKHYKLLSHARASKDTVNAFFYVSSSEWNLYDYIRDFSKQHQLPQGIYLLNQVKTFSQVFKTGQNNHGTKFMRISRILEAYPQQQFILLGDDSQEDPKIYTSLVKHFGQQIFCIYIRCVGKNVKPPVEEMMNTIKEAGIHCCYFDHSADAIAHSISIGLVG